MAGRLENYLGIPESGKGPGEVVVQSRVIVTLSDVTDVVKTDRKGERRMRDVGERSQALPRIIQKKVAKLAKCVQDAGIERSTSNDLLRSRLVPRRSASD